MRLALLCLTTLLVAVGCGSAGDDEVTGTNAGAATVNEMGGATASLSTIDADEAGANVSYPVVRGGGMSDAELTRLNRELEEFAEGLASKNAGAEIVCRATIATPELAAMACSIAQPGAAGAQHAALHFVPRKGERISLRALIDDEEDAVMDVLGETYERIQEEQWGESSTSIDAAAKKRILDSAVVSRTGIIVQDAAIGMNGYDVATWKDLEDALPSKGTLAELAATTAPAPLAGNGAWRWAR